VIDAFAKYLLISATNLARLFAWFRDILLELSLFPTNSEFIKIQEIPKCRWKNIVIIFLDIPSFTSLAFFILCGDLATLKIVNRIALAYLEDR
jgi:hypothetical protein